MSKDKSVDKEVGFLVSLGHAQSRREATALRDEIIEGGETVAGWLKARPQVGVGADSDTLDENNEINALMSTEKVSEGLATWFRNRLIADGSSVRAYLIEQAQVGSTDPPMLVTAKAANALIEIAGSKDQAIEVIGVL